MVQLQTTHQRQHCQGAVPVQPFRVILQPCQEIRPASQVTKEKRPIHRSLVSFPESYLKRERRRTWVKQAEQEFPLKATPRPKPQPVVKPRRP